MARALLLGLFAGVLSAVVLAAWNLMGWGFFWEPAFVVRFLLRFVVYHCVWCVLLCLGEEFVRGYPAWGRIGVLVTLAGPALLISTVGCTWGVYLYEARCSTTVALDYALRVVQARGFGSAFWLPSCLGFLVVFLVRTLGVRREFQLPLIGALATPLCLLVYYDPLGHVLKLCAISFALLVGESLEQRLLRRWCRRRRRRRAA